MWSISSALWVHSKIKSSRSVPGCCSVRSSGASVTRPTVAALKSLVRGKLAASGRQLYPTPLSQLPFSQLASNSQVICSHKANAGIWPQMCAGAINHNNVSDINLSSKQSVQHTLVRFVALICDEAIAAMAVLQNQLPQHVIEGGVTSLCSRCCPVL